MYGAGQQEVWQRLLVLESRDAVQQRFERIHGQELNSRRAGEINAAARQAREYFRNASASDFSVRPLLTFYGVASLSRALALLMKRTGGEEGLTAGHGLEAAGWRNAMSGEIGASLEKLGDLKIRRRQGLLSDFLVYAGNITLLHRNSTAVDSRWGYGEPDMDAEIALGDLFCRTPDLKADHGSVETPRYAAVSAVTYSQERGFQATLAGDRAQAVAEAYGELGYSVAGSGQGRTLRCDSATLHREVPMFLHAYVQKVFGSIPDLHLAEPLRGGIRLSQLSITHMISYALGMLVRYYPTHWMALIHGGRGDLLWPTINRAQQYVEGVYPELAAEFTEFEADNPRRVAQRKSK